MSATNEDIQKLNQIIAIIDEQASTYQRDRRNMPQIKADAQKKLIIDLINNGLLLAKQIGQQASGISGDLERLKKQLNAY